MAINTRSEDIDPDYPGSDNHHSLKNNPGEAGDPGHTGTDAAPSGKLQEAVEASDAATQIADELRGAIDDDTEHASEKS